MGVHLLIGRLRLLVGGLVGLLVGLLLRLSLIGVVGLAGTIGPLRLSLVGVAGLLRGLVDVVRLRGLPPGTERCRTPGPDRARRAARACC